MQTTVVLPPLLKPADMWHHIMNERLGRYQYVNILTRERYHHHIVIIIITIIIIIIISVFKMEDYNGEGIAKAYDLHQFQTPGTSSSSSSSSSSSPSSL